MQKLSAKWVPKCLNADQKRQRCQSSQHLLECFWRDWWSWTKPGYITMNRKQSNNQRSGGIAAHPAPKNSVGKNLLENSHLDFLGSRRHPSHWLSSKGPNYQRGGLLISASATEGHFEGNTSREGHKGGHVLAQQCPGSPVTCNPQETDLPVLPMSWSPTLFSGSGHVGLLPVLWTEKTIERSPYLSDAKIIAAAENWLNRQHSDFFLGGLQKFEEL